MNEHINAAQRELHLPDFHLPALERLYNAALEEAAKALDTVLWEPAGEDGNTPAKVVRALKEGEQS